MPAIHRILGAISLLIFATSAGQIVELRAGTLSASVSSYLETAYPSRIKTWIYFADHGESSKAELRNMLNRVQINQRALERRTRRSPSSLADRHDLPVNIHYIDAVRELGGEVRHESRYFNAVSAWVTSDQMQAIADLPFVRHIDRVKTGMRRVQMADQSTIKMLQKTPRLGDTIDYGLSDAQHEMINTKPLHAEGYNGRGVRVAVFDTGFFRAHPALAHLNLIAEWDFINDDGYTGDDADDVEGQMTHGTFSLGILASYWPGTTMGVAWDAEYILAKTELAAQEIRSEEDDYIAALEWADALGADIVSSSLGYFYWYTKDDMDGDTALITRAVDIAASRGILVVTAAGNEGTSAWGTIIAPADADSAIAVGAVDVSGVIKEFSSRGPTADGRIKPDVVAQGQLVATLGWQEPPSPAAGSGTSAATPLVSGAAALILQKHPDWSPIHVRDALRATASQTDTPDNVYGWGIIDATAAADYSAGVTVNIDVRPGSCSNAFNPKSRGVLPVLLLGSDELDVRAVDIATLRLSGGAALRANVIDIAGEGECSSPSPDGYDDLLVKFDLEEVAASVAPLTKGGTLTLTLSGELRDGTPIDGEDAVRIVGNQGGPALTGDTRTEVATGLGSAVPNPFNPITHIPYSVARSAHVEITVYDVRGRLVATLVDATRPAGTHTAVWDASGQSSGVYFYRLRTGDVEATRKLLLLK
ncbi:MAG: S8 family peptidase [Candidatus Latescibacterota bacterium]|nr:MAG: S8 family peptidase [Candidatus Latescibacterota bacterium]